MKWRFERALKAMDLLVHALFSPRCTVRFSMLRNGNGYVRADHDRGCCSWPLVLEEWRLW